jgi:hypothetical protein
LCEVAHTREIFIGRLVLIASFRMSATGLPTKG